MSTPLFLALDSAAHSPSSDQLITDQILHNLAAFIDSPAAFPAQVTISSGTAQTTGTLGGKISNQAKEIDSSTAAAAVHTFKSYLPGVEVSPQASWTQSWNFDNVTDTDQLRRLTALYRFAIDNNEAALIRNYPPITKTVTTKITKDACKDSGRSCSDELNAPSEAIDEHFTKEPQCVVCGVKNRYVNPRLKAPNGWLRWTALPGATPIFENPPAPNDVLLGSGAYGHYQLFADRAHAGIFQEFALAIMGATASSNDGGGQSGGGGGKKKGGGNKAMSIPPLQVLPQ